MIFNYQHKKKEIKKTRSLDCSISLNDGEGGLYRDCAYRVTVDFDIKLHVVNNEAKHLKMNIWFVYLFKTMLCILCNFNKNWVHHFLITYSGFINIQGLLIFVVKVKDSFKDA